MAYAIVVLINILFFILLVFGIYLGLKRGLIYSALHCGFVVVSLILSLLISAPISNAILNITVAVQNGQAVTLAQSLLGTSITQSSQTLTSMISGVAAVIIFPLVLIVIAILFYLLFELGYQLLTRLYLKKNNLIKNRFSKNYGIIFGFIEMFCFAVFVFMPITSLIGVVGDLTNKDKNPTISEIACQVVPEGICQGCQAYNASPMAKIISFWGLGDSVYSGFAGIGTNISYKQDLLVTINSVSDGVEQYSKGNFQQIKQDINKIIDAPFISNNLDKILKDFIKNKSSFIASFGGGYDLEEALDLTLNNFEIKLQQEDYSLTGQFKLSFSNIVDGLQKAAESNLFEALTSSISDMDYYNLMSAKFLTSVKETVMEVVKMPLADDAFPMVKYALKSLPGFLKNYVDIDWLTSMDITREEVGKVFDCAITMAEEDEKLDTKVLPALVLGEDDFYLQMTNSPSYEKIMGSFISSRCLNRLIISTFHILDKNLNNSLRSLNSSVSIKDSEFEISISYFDTPEEKEQFISTLNTQLDDFVALSRVLLQGNKGADFFSNLLNIMQPHMKKYCVGTDSSNSIFAAMFSNIIRYFTGQIKQSRTDIPAFANSQLFNERVEQQFEKLNANGQYSQQDKYYLVSYPEILQGLI